MKIIAVVMVLALSGCAGLPSVGACRVAEYKRVGDMWSARLEDCRVIQSGGAAGLIGAAIPGL
jgi:hypothetical protein